MAAQSTRRSTDDVTHWCGNVFEAFALTVEDVAECHAELDEDEAGSVADLVRAARRRPSSFPDPVTFVRDSLVASNRGVDAPARYWANAPEVHLDALFAPFDCRVTVEWRRDDTRRIVLEDAAGAEFRATLTYPDTPLGRDNYPALLNAVNRNLLPGTGVELVLFDGPSERWQFGLVETAALDNLRRRYGETVQFGSRGLLAEHRPREYVPDEGDDVPVPDWMSESVSDRVPGRASESRTRSDDGVPFHRGGESFADLVERIDRTGRSFADVDPDALCADDAEVARETPPADDVAALLSDLSDVRPQENRDDSDRVEGPETPVLGSSDRSDKEEEEEEAPAIDELFRRLERDVAAQSRNDIDDAADPTRRTDPAATPSSITDAPTSEADEIGSSAFVWLDERRIRSRAGRP